MGGLVNFLHGFIGGMCCSGVLVIIFATMLKNDHDAALNGVGIKEIKRCVVDIVGCKSNYYEIVWLDETKNSRKVLTNGNK